MKPTKPRNTVLPPTPQLGQQLEDQRQGDVNSSQWLSNLIAQSNPAHLPSKAQRIEKRLAKKKHKEDKHRRHKDDSREAKMVSRNKESSQRHAHEAENVKNLRFIARLIETCSEGFALHKRHMFVPKEPKGKAIVWKKKWTETSIQPRPRDYGGLGMARASLFLSLSDPSFMPKLEQEFEEHIPGFFGKQRTKSMKKQLDGNMLWRQLAEKRLAKVNGRNLSDMNPDERVEALIAAGHL